MSKTPPLAVCTKCYTYSYRAESINERCAERRGRDRCTGLMGSALGNDDWQTCSGCGGAGRKDGTSCGACQGTGWEYCRGRIGR